MFECRHSTVDGVPYTRVAFRELGETAHTSDFFLRPCKPRAIVHDHRQVFCANRTPGPLPRQVHEQALQGFGRAVIGNPRNFHPPFFAPEQPAHGTKSPTTFIPNCRAVSRKVSARETARETWRSFDIHALNFFRDQYDGSDRIINDPTVASTYDHVALRTKVILPPSM